MVRLLDCAANVLLAVLALGLVAVLAVVGFGCRGG
jgi:hypothetical protein